MVVVVCLGAVHEGQQADPGLRSTCFMIDFQQELLLSGRQQRPQDSCIHNIDCLTRNAHQWQHTTNVGRAANSGVIQTRQWPA